MGDCLQEMLESLLTNLKMQLETALFWNTFKDNDIFLDNYYECEWNKS